MKKFRKKLIYDFIQHVWSYNWRIHKIRKVISVHTKELKVSSRWWFWVDLEGSVAVG